MISLQFYTNYSLVYTILNYQQKKPKLSVAVDVSIYILYKVVVFVNHAHMESFWKANPQIHSQKLIQRSLHTCKRNSIVNVSKKMYRQMLQCRRLLHLSKHTREAKFRKTRNCVCHLDYPTLSIHSACRQQHIQIMSFLSGNFIWNFVQVLYCSFQSVCIVSKHFWLQSFESQISSNSSISTGDYSKKRFCRIVQ